MERRKFLALATIGSIGGVIAASLLTPTQETSVSSPKRFETWSDIPMDKFYPELQGVNPKSKDKLTVEGINIFWANYSTATFNPTGAETVYQYWNGLARRNLSVTINLGNERHEIALRPSSFSQGAVFLIDESTKQPKWDTPGIPASTQLDFPEGFATYVRIAANDATGGRLPFQKRTTNALVFFGVEAAHAMVKPHSLTKTLDKAEQKIVQEIVGNSFGQALGYAAENTPFLTYVREIRTNSANGRYRMNALTPLTLFTITEEEYSKLPRPAIIS